MGYFATKNIAIVKEPELINGHGRNGEWHLCKLFLVENHQKYNKDTEEWEDRGSTAYNAVVWGDKAIEAAMLPVGTILELMPETTTTKTGEEYLKFKAFIEENSYTNKEGETISQLQLEIKDFNVKTFDK